MLAINTCKSRRGQKGLGRVPGPMWGTALAILESGRSLSPHGSRRDHSSWSPDSSELFKAKQKRGGNHAHATRVNVQHNAPHLAEKLPTGWDKGVEIIKQI
jgi:hypothetical protein